MRNEKEIKELMKFFLNHQMKKEKPLVLIPAFYHAIGVKKGSLKDSIHVLPIFREVLGEDYIKKFISNIEGKTIDINDYDDIEIGGYDFEFKFKVDGINEYRGSVFLEISVEIEPGGEVTLITDGETYSFEEWEEMEDGVWGEVKMEITDLIIEILRHEITEYTGINDISIHNIKYF